jgi:hypothetical protein
MQSRTSEAGDQVVFDDMEVERAQHLARYCRVAISLQKREKSQ